MKQRHVFGMRDGHFMPIFQIKGIDYISIL